MIDLIINNGCTRFTQKFLLARLELVTWAETYELTLVRPSLALGHILKMRCFGSEHVMTEHASVWANCQTCMLTWTRFPPFLVFFLKKINPTFFNSNNNNIVNKGITLSKRKKLIKKTGLILIDTNHKQYGLRFLSLARFSIGFWGAAKTPWACPYNHL